MTNNTDIMLGYDLEQWSWHGKREPIIADGSLHTNSHMILCGISGSGKSHETNLIVARLAGNKNGQVYFADYKQDDQFAYMQTCKNYYPFKRTIEAVKIVYDKMQRRQSGEDPSREPITLVVDEYMAWVLSLPKKEAEQVTKIISEILMMGRSLGCRLIVTMQRADMTGAFTAGSRINFGVIIILGAPIKSIYEMLMPREYIEKIGERVFKRGEGIVLFQGSDLRYIKVPMVRDKEKMQKDCIEALSRG